MIVEVERVLEGPVDLYLSDSVFEFLMSFRTLDSVTHESVYLVARMLKVWVDLGLRDSPILTDEGDGIHGIEIGVEGKIVGFFHGRQDFIGVDYYKPKTKNLEKIIQHVAEIKTKERWRAKQ